MRTYKITPILKDIKISKTKKVKPAKTASTKVTPIKNKAIKISSPKIKPEEKVTPKKTKTVSTSKKDVKAHTPTPTPLPTTTNVKKIPQPKIKVKKIIPFRDIEIKNIKVIIDDNNYISQLKKLFRYYKIKARRGEFDKYIFLRNLIRMHILTIQRERYVESFEHFMLFLFQNNTAKALTLMTNDERFPAIPENEYFKMFVNTIYKNIDPLTFTEYEQNEKELHSLQYVACHFNFAKSFDEYFYRCINFVYRLF